MEKTRHQRYAEHLDQVIDKNEEFLESAIEELRRRGLAAAGSDQYASAAAAGVRELCRDFYARLAEINAIRQTLRKKYRQYIRRNPARDKRIASHEHQAKILLTRFDRVPSFAEDAERPRPGSFPIRYPAERWFHDVTNCIAFTKNLRLLDELEYEEALSAGAVRTAPYHRLQVSDRCFTLFSLQGPAVALDALSLNIRLWEHDLMERFSAGEIRGALTHLRPLRPDHVELIFVRILAGRFPEIRCILFTVRTAEQIDERLIRSLKRAEKEMKPGELRFIDPGWE